MGLLITAGWYVTGHVGFVPEDPETLEALYVGTNTHRPESLTFVAPLAFGLEWLTLWTDGSRHVTFGIAAMVGTLAGAGAHARLTGKFRWELFTSPADVGRHLAGAVLMGFGGVGGPRMQHRAGHHGNVYAESRCRTHPAFGGRRQHRVP